MDIKEIGTWGTFVVGGAIFGVTQMGLGDALSEDIRPVSEISYEERPAYMEKITGEFAEAFDSYTIESETYAYVGISKFSTAPAAASFSEIVTQDSAVPQDEIKGLTAIMDTMDFCNQAEMTMFTQNGWTYHFTMVDSEGKKIFAADCLPAPQLRGMS